MTRAKRPKRGPLSDEDGAAVAVALTVIFVVVAVYLALGGYA